MKMTICVYTVGQNVNRWQNESFIVPAINVLTNRITTDCYIITDCHLINDCHLIIIDIRFIRYDFNPAIDPFPHNDTF